MDRNFFIAIVLCAGIYVAWYQYNLKYNPQYVSNLAIQNNNTVSTQNVQNLQSIKQVIVNQNNNLKSTNVKREIIKLGDDSYSAFIDTQGGVIFETKINNFKKADSDLLNKIIGSKRQAEVLVNTTEYQYISNVIYEVKSKTENDLVLEYNDENVNIIREYRLNKNLYFLDLSISINFKKNIPGYLFYSIRGIRDPGKIENERRQFIYSKFNSKNETFTAESVKELHEDTSQGNWIGLESRYFLSALIDNDSLVKPQFQLRPVDNNEVIASLIYKVQGSSFIIKNKYYFGPKEIDTLKKVGHKLETAVDFGWFTVFALPLLWLLKWFNAFVHNYGISIILLTILIKILLYPLTFKSMKSMKDMQKIQPKLNAIREKYKDDKEALNREMMNLMKTHGYNPLSGCLPMFIQMPVFIALYNVLYGAIDLYGQPFFGWIRDLSAKDPYYVTPLLLALMMFLQQKLTPTTTTDPAQQKAMMFMPIVFAFMMLWLPSGLTLYMLVNSIISIIQQMIINKKLGILKTA